MRQLARAVVASLLLGASGPQAARPWSEMDYGPFLSATLQVGKGDVACKGIAVRLDAGPGGVARGGAFALFDTDTLRWAGAWTGGFIDWRGIVFDGAHGVHPSASGEVWFTTPAGPGWGHPENGGFDDPRLLGRDGRRYGPLPAAWGRWNGLYVHGGRVVLSYRIGETEILELPGWEDGLVTRTLRLGPRPRALTLRVGGGAGVSLELGAIAVLPGPPRVAAARIGGGAWSAGEDGALQLKVEAGSEPLAVKLLFAPVPGGLEDFAARAAASPPPEDVAALTRGGPSRWKEVQTTEAPLAGPEDGPYAVESIPLPSKNPWRSWMRPGGFDFFADGRRAAVCTWSGDVWIVDGLGRDPGRLEWRRIAAGLFQPLGLRIVDGAIHVCGRDQITRLEDLDGDGEADFYRNFNNDHQVTPHFHEFAMDLQTDLEGNFYYAKAARHALESVVPHHGTVIRVSRDGGRSEIVCNGFRAPNGLGIGPRGELVTSDQEGHWVPANRVNLLAPGGFYGNRWSWCAGPAPETYAPPLLWFPKKADRSPAQQLWVAGDRWGPLEGRMLSLSYGTGQIFLVLADPGASVPQGAAVRLPMRFPTGIMRGRFHAGDGQLYACGLFGWSSDRTAPGGFYRVRRTGRPLHVPTAFRATPKGIELTFASALNRDVAGDPDRWGVRRWNYLWSQKYGSEHYRPSGSGQVGEDAAEVRGIAVSADGRTVSLELEDFGPVMQLEVRYALRTADGADFRDTLWATVNELPR